MNANSVGDGKYPISVVYETEELENRERALMYACNVWSRARVIATPTSEFEVFFFLGNDMHLPNYLAA